MVFKDFYTGKETRVKVGWSISGYSYDAVIMQKEDISAIRDMVERDRDKALEYLMLLESRSNKECQQQSGLFY